MKITVLNFETNFPIDFFLALNTCPKEADERDEWGENFAKEWGLTYRSGISRGVFVFNDFVIKFDIDADFNGCENEYECFYSARDYDIERILLPIEEWYLSPRKVMFYIQPRCGDPIYDTKLSEYSDVYFQIKSQLKNNGYCERKIKKIMNDVSYTRIDFFWLVRAVQYYGWKFMNRFVNWIEDCDINDLHGANIGFVGNGRPVIFDYAGC